MSEIKVNKISEGIYEIKKGVIIDGLLARKISEKPVKVEFDIEKKLTPQLCLLIKNNSNAPEKIKIKYDKREQTFYVNWNKWGWAPISLTEKFDKNKKVKFIIEPVKENSKLVISKIYLKNLNLGYTD